MVIRYTEHEYNKVNNEVVPVYDWIFGDSLDKTKLILGRSKHGADAWENFKVVDVTDSDKFTYDLKKTKINASGGVMGLVEYMNRCVEENINTSSINQILNHAWNNMKCIIVQ